MNWGWLASRSEPTPQAFQTLREFAGAEPIRYCMRPVISWRARKLATALGVSPLGSTDTAMICALAAVLAPIRFCATRRLEVISGQMSGQFV